MTYAAIFIMILYFFSLMAYFQGLFPFQARSRWFYVIAALLLIILVYWFASYSGIYWLSLPLSAIILATALRLSCKMSWLQAMYCGSLSVLSVYCFRGMFTAIIAIFLRKSYGDFLLQSNSYYMVTLFALPIAFACFVLLRGTIFPDEQIKRLLDHRESLKSLVSYEATSVVYFSIVNQGRYFSPYVPWFIGISLGASILTLGMLLYSTYQAIRSIELMEYKWRSRALEEQYLRQLRHYKSYQRFTESFRAFKHDYRSIILPLKSLIMRHENEKAMELLDQICDSIQNQVEVHKTYSDHAVLDAMLQDLANICIENNIQFSFRVFVPRNTELSLLEAVRIFSNLTNNAVEACCKLPVPQRFIEVTSYHEHGWMTLQVTNSFNGDITISNGRFVTTKKDKKFHGIGIQIVNEIVEKMGGFTDIVPDVVQRTVTFRVHIPRN